MERPAIANCEAICSLILLASNKGIRLQIDRGEEEFRTYGATLTTPEDTVIIQRRKLIPVEGLAKRRSYNLVASARSGVYTMI
jgi:hypothetical protein